MQRELRELKERQGVEIHLLCSGKFTLVKAIYYDLIDRFEAEGIARLSNVDSWNFVTGFQIAEGRALKALQKKLAGKPVKSLFMA